MAGHPITLAKLIKGYFETSDYWEYEKTLGNGSYGLAILLKQKGDLGERGLRIGQQRMAVKIALESAAQELRAEIRWLKRLNGAKHIVRILASCDDVAEASKDRRASSKRLARRVQARFMRLLRVPPRTAFDSLAALQGPVLALEYLENGDMVDLLTKLHQTEARIPNRILWSMYLCLIRACIGLAYPIGRPIGAPPITEAVPTDGTMPATLIHNDIAARNIMLGAGDGMNEHSLGHIFKLIDFGAMRENPGIGWGPPSNLYDISRFISECITMSSASSLRVVYRGRETRAAHIMPHYGTRFFPWLDPGLSDLVSRCMYANFYDRPSLKEALDQASNAVLMKEPDSYPRPAEESDDAIKNFLQEYLYDASN
ncbi:kinase-like protein [Xylariaceae sp. FL1651]|nr:kinase-like protein [Xylariaceae sp. FL1651]